ncbi:DUF4283 domain protein, partial [Trifolium medium]|nr:DUF4283 domain protein [Trifolium medium]
EDELEGNPHRTVTDFQAVSPLVQSLVQGDKVHDLSSDDVTSTIKQPVDAAVSSSPHKPSMGSLDIGGSMKNGSGIIFSTKKKLNKGKRQSDGRSEVSVKAPHKKKVGGVLHHTMQNLRKVARLPGKDRKEVLKILKKEVRRRQGGSRATTSVEVVKQVSSDSGSSLASVNKDWENWVVMHGNEKVAVED